MGVSGGALWGWVAFGSPAITAPPAIVARNSRRFGCASLITRRIACLIRYNMATMTQFNEKKQEERLHELRSREEEQLAEILAHKYGVEYVDLTSKSIDTDALRLLEETRARSAEVATFRRMNKKLFLAMRAPERADALQAAADLERLGYEVHRFITSKASLDHAWERYKDISYATETEAGVLTVSK